MPQIQTPPYVITARTPQGVFQQTRTLAASAVVLAMKLREEGHTVEVMDPMGNLISPECIRDSINAGVSRRAAPR